MLAKTILLCFDDDLERFHTRPEVVHRSVVASMILLPVDPHEPVHSGEKQKGGDIIMSITKS
jgi:hypothetical protein